MKFPDANRIAKDWLKGLALPQDLRGKQINVHAYLGGEDVGPIYLAKKRHLSRELKRRGARVVGEVDRWTYEQSQLACDFYIQELKQFLLSKEPRKQHYAINYLTTELNKTNKAVRLKMHHISSILVNSDLPYLEYFSPIPCAEIGLIDWNETQVLKTLLVEKFNDPHFVEFLSSLSDKRRLSQSSLVESSSEEEELI